MISLSIIGLIGGACFAWAAVPTAIKVLKLGHNPGVPKLMAWLIFSGTIFIYSYLFLKFFLVSGVDKILTLNYSVEATSWGIILFYTYFPRKVVVSS